MTFDVFCELCGVGLLSCSFVSNHVTVLVAWLILRVFLLHMAEPTEPVGEAAPESADDEFVLPENACGACGQEFGQQDEAVVLNIFCKF